MNTIHRDIFKAVHENKWLSIEYKNKDGEVTRYWIGIRKICLKDLSMTVDGLHLSKYVTQELKIFIGSILTSAVIDGSYYEVPAALKNDIRQHPHRYRPLFYNVANLKILNYLADCNRLDYTPYKTEYSLIQKIDSDSFHNRSCRLTPEQFQEIVSNFQIQARNRETARKIKQLAINVISINTRNGLYVLAYRKLNLDVRNKCLKSDEDITICTEFTINGNRQSIRRFLDADDLALLADPEPHLEQIKNRITQSASQVNGVDDMPYLIAIGRDLILDVQGEYAGIVKMFEEGRATVPLKAFFGGLIKAPERRKDYPITLLNRQINLDQLLAIHNAVKYPLAYIQGPPGTGKTNTIVNTIVTAFFNEKTVLFASYNNHPIDGVCRKLQRIPYLEKDYIPFPMIRLGDNSRVDEALDEIRNLYEKTQNLKIYDRTLERNKGSRIDRTKELTALLKRYEERLDLIERKEALDALWEENSQYLNFQTQLDGVQRKEMEQRLKQIGEITDDEALKLVLGDEDAFKKYLYYISARYIKRLGEPKNEDLMKIVFHENREERVRFFNDYLSKEENVKKFLRIFPIVATTSISSHKIGEPKPYFDMTIMDEASQGNLAVSLVPVIRGKNLMLVGDPQQLSPVILLDPKDNAILRKMYGVPEEYDYLKNSIYKTFLACDAISDEILLSHHYRCDKRIIAFNNKKYYNNKLIIDTGERTQTPLRFLDVPENTTQYKNTAPSEAEEIAAFAKDNPDKSIGVITPFANQKECINETLKQNGITNVTCGTVHAFQGDEKDIVLFSLALTDKTSPKTYEWLKNNKELINVATSRAREQLILLSSRRELERLHGTESDDIYELAQYVATKGTSEITARTTESRALGIRPYSSETETAFLENLNHALGNVLYTGQKCSVRREVSVSHILGDNDSYRDLFYTGYFDFVVYRQEYPRKEIPLLAIELDKKEPYDGDLVKERDRQKARICKNHGFELIQIENSYARRYNYIKDILIRYFKSVKGY